MILDRLENLLQYSPAHSGLAAVAGYLESADLASLPDGRHPIDGERLLVITEHSVGRGQQASPLEAHRRYIDLQIVLSGDEVMGWRPTSDCRAVSTPFEVGRDIIFFSDRPLSWIAVQPGMFAVFFPEDAHAPLAGAGPVHKAVFKICKDWSA